ncbi:uncharacterized protein LOC112588919 [Harpegnathos saltator]|uniref:uncharacterized protein LOC112588919 n=1 Tax=Harpegnathos saltator TaxID=610380 RepID=UPI000DBED204|nr:uncharacterized protein LOC112588919 [Harpegnathos saltator]
MGPPTFSHRPQQVPDAPGNAAGGGVGDQRVQHRLVHAGDHLAGSPTVELLAEERYLLYWRIKELREEGEGLAARDLKALKIQARARVLDKWSAELADPRGFGLQTAEAVRSCLPKMADRRGRGLSFHLVQVLTGHGCFGKNLHRIGKEPTTECHHCPGPVDSAHHTLTACEA